MSHANQHDPCLLCMMEEADETRIVFRDELWAAEIVPGYEVPGWIILRVRRHAERITSLTNNELATLAYRARDLTAAITDVTGAPVTYLLVFGENYAHFHVLIAPREEDVPTERRGGNILQHRLEASDASAARQLLPAIRAAYAAAGRTEER